MQHCKVIKILKNTDNYTTLYNNKNLNNTDTYTTLYSNNNFE